MASADVHSDIIKCPICLENFNNPRSLPCVHAFCLECIRSYCKDQQPGESAQCPMCRSQFKIPDCGIDGLPHNFFIQSLVDANLVSRKESTSVEMCEVCMEEHAEEPEKISTATTFCVDCCQKLCSTCSTPHRRMKGGAHVVKSLSVVVTTEMVEVRGNNCERHPGKLVELYCTQCKTNICLMCFALEHQQHKCDEISKAAQSIVSEVDDKVTQISLCIGEFEKDAIMTNENRDKFIAEIAQLEKSINDSAAENKRLIDSHFNQLMNDVLAIKTETLKSFQSGSEKIETDLLSMRSLSAYWTELKSKGRPTDVTRAGQELSLRSSQLVDTFERSQGPTIAPNVKFQPINIVKPRGAQRINNVVGTVTCNRSQTAPGLVNRRRMVSGQNSTPDLAQQPRAHHRKHF